ncbi:uncharacterized protein LY89DRAFT_742943 [Mollisia scopiformis]|uniref:Uncharacterized protein n=1 Tax=Mollisia scopiformis TaxID=149040 RepID=A0A132B4P5_MOLSC|nr:uncharacterized protein LY89DRAFT_742943 [Mollisia scopiformis]KUJ07301.1 hypothetical protein LY89DRAFT_742943 [Mollisia scopiformis]
MLASNNGLLPGHYSNTSLPVEHSASPNLGPLVTSAPTQYMLPPLSPESYSKLVAEGNPDVMFENYLNFDGYDQMDATTTAAQNSHAQSSLGQASPMDMTSHYGQTERLSPEPETSPAAAPASVPSSPGPSAAPVPAHQHAAVANHVHANGGANVHTATNVPAANVANPQASTNTDSLWPTICYFCKPDANGQHVLYYNWNEWLLHGWTVHPNVELWTARPCFWEETKNGVVEKCNNGVTYLTARQCIYHIFAVHKKSVHCDHADCEYGPTGKALGTRQDKVRHVQDMHEPAKTCQLPFCTHTKRRLNRTDHRKGHMRKYHGRHCCPVATCERARLEGDFYGFSTEEELQAHKQARRHRHARRQN